MNFLKKSLLIPVLCAFLLSVLAPLAAAANDVLPPDPPPPESPPPGSGD